MQAAASPTRGTTGRPTKTAMEQYQIASDELAAEIPKLRKLIETDIKALEKQLDAAGAPPTPGPSAGLERRQIVRFLTHRRGPDRARCSNPGRHRK